MNSVNLQFIAFQKIVHKYCDHTLVIQKNIYYSIFCFFHVFQFRVPLDIHIKITTSKCNICFHIRRTLRQPNDSKRNLSYAAETVYERNWNRIAPIGFYQYLVVFIQRSSANDSRRRDITVAKEPNYQT